MSSSISAGIGDFPCFTTFGHSLVSLFFDPYLSLKFLTFLSTCDYSLFEIIGIALQ